MEGLRIRALSLFGKSQAVLFAFINFKTKKQKGW